MSGRDDSIERIESALRSIAQLDDRIDDLDGCGVRDFGAALRSERMRGSRLAGRAFADLDAIARDLRSRAGSNPALDHGIGEIVRADARRFDAQASDESEPGRSDAAIALSTIVRMIASAREAIERGAVEESARSASAWIRSAIERVEWSLTQLDRIERELRVDLDDPRDRSGR